ncbi:MAG: tetratricopeptide repeat protein [Deltaproteobacteria bacterium]|mgnify:CR=1 FL=1|nr:tetratricopeptide repeat protein [Deltaproteobacteria bacterium]MBW1923632.1 tetratricopeptide repeat protein [Deltaproteobacteria bacterium]MBW1948593.1 tetratricopeptide repeat protein [Deltaproteobacteria bacterium]MBW2007958.1 tetratricopeptide repeat protein [Deltaproteobacteria bacterium]RLB39728.1 MAG: hypothetical protein DRH20_02990 [Deltaproteobacteria bacterium]
MWKRASIPAGILTIVFLAAFWLGGCGPKPRPPESALDTPEHHAFNGFKLLEKERIQDARREFELALQLDPKFSPAHRGMGLILGMNEEFKQAFRTMRLAKKYAKNKEEKAMAWVGNMRLYTMWKGEDWLEEVEDCFEEAKDLIPDLPEAYYYLGMAYKAAFKFGDAEKAFKKVLEIDKRLVGPADDQLKVVQKIERAMPGTEIGKHIAVLDRITRADVAALFIQELHLDRVYEKARPRTFDTSFKSPKEAFNRKVALIPRDISDHTLRTDIEAVLALDIQGLGIFPNGTFAPDKYITRANYAMMIADIIATIKHDPSLNSRYVGSPTPFLDVRNDVPYFNAVMLCTTWGGIMEAKDGVFNPMGYVPGADALLIIRKLKEELKIF